MARVGSTTGKTRTPAVGMARLRRELEHRMDALAAAPDHRFADGYTQLLACLERGFQVEEEAIEAVNFHAAHTHREEHARALSALHQAAPRIEAGDIALGREALVLLRRFLAMHRPTVDIALSSTGVGPGQRVLRWARQRRAAQGNDRVVA